MILCVGLLIFQPRLKYFPRNSEPLTLARNLVRTGNGPSSTEAKGNGILLPMETSESRSWGIYVIDKRELRHRVLLETL
jgi:hypothetical protein